MLSQKIYKNLGGMLLSVCIMSPAIAQADRNDPPELAILTGTCGKLISYDKDISKICGGKLAMRP